MKRFVVKTWLALVLASTLVDGPHLRAAIPSLAPEAWHRAPA
jgi:hypothetical protein